MSENRVAPGQTLRVTMLTHPLLNYLRIARPAATGCAACGRSWTAHDEATDQIPCERCGIEMAFDCYLRHTAVTAVERWWWSAPDEDCQHMYQICLCRGCRS